ncbi:MAG: hypothetical protein WBB74_04900 [Gaiellaceae bacterium]
MIAVSRQQTAGAPIAVDRRELALCAALAGLLCALFLVIVPAGGDLAAHIYRTWLVRQGVFVWDNLWFAGQYPLFSYSLLYYLIAAVTGTTALALVGIIVGAILFAALVLREWGPLARWPARSFAVLSTGQFFTGAYPYVLGFAALLATLWSLQKRRLWLGGLFAVLTLGISPLAFLFLVLALLAVFLRTRRLNSAFAAAAIALAVGVGVEVGVLLMFPTPGLYYPYGLWRLLAGLGIAGVGAALAVRGRGGSSLALMFLVWAGATIAAYLVRSPVGHNIVRLDALVFPLMLLAASIARFRPRWLAAVALTAAFASNVVPYLTMIPDRTADPTNQASFWSPSVRYLAAHASGSAFRVEVVPTINHWESYYLPHAGFALARGWYRQLDMAANPVLFADRLTPRSYRGWLRNAGVRFVVLPHAALDQHEATREASLLTSGRSGLRRVFEDRSSSVFELGGASPILTGPAPATVSILSPSRIAGRLNVPGTYLLRVHYTSYWQVKPGGLCLSPTRGGMTKLKAAKAGGFSLRAIESPGALVGRLLDSDAACG